MVYTLFRDPEALNSELAALGTRQPRAFGTLKSHIDLDYYQEYITRRRRVLNCVLCV